MEKRRTIWKGTTDEALALLHALREYCDCHVEQGRITSACAGHLMLARDQRAIDGLLFMRRMAPGLLVQEFRTDEPSSEVPTSGVFDKPGTITTFP